MTSPLTFSRRAFLGPGAQGLGAVALASLLQPRLLSVAPSGGVLPALPLPQGARRVPEAALKCVQEDTKTALALGQENAVKVSRGFQITHF